MSPMQRKGKTTAKDVTVERNRAVKTITIPEGMPLKEAVMWLQRKDQEEDKVVEVNHKIDAFPLDGAVAFRDALEDIYGFVQSVGTPSFWGENPPQMISIPVSATKHRDVPWGRVQIPGISGNLNTWFTCEGGFPKFVVYGEVKQRHLPEVNKIIRKTAELLKKQSIYKGKAIRLDLSWLRDNPNPEKVFNPTGHAPQFSIPTDKVVESDLIFSEVVQMDIQLGLFTPIECSAKCRQHEIPPKRGVLLAGDYGTGKTLTAFVTAKKAVRHGFTFIYLSNVLDLANGFKFAQQYAPAVIFAEDIDAIASGKRNVAMNEIFNSFDGLDTKSGEIVTVLTTNHLENIHQALILPGRCDTLVQITRPDRDAAARLVKLYGRGLIDENADFEVIGDVLNDHLPAEIREAIERAKLAAIYRLVSSGKMTDDDGLSIEGHVSEKDIVAAVHSMETQHRLLEPKEIDNRTSVERAAEELGKGIGDATGSRLAELTVGLVEKLGLASQKDLFRAAKLINAPEEVRIGSNDKELVDKE